MSATLARIQHASEFSSQFEYLLATARNSAALEGLNYAGDVTPRQAWALFSAGFAEILDVRTYGELQQVGYVQDAVHVEWLSGPQMQQNPHFIKQLKLLGKNDNIILLLCRSGKRSVAAAEALSKAGFSNIFNIQEGFEGDGRPGSGWLKQGLPAAHN